MTFAPEKNIETQIKKLSVTRGRVPLGIDRCPARGNSPADDPTIRLSELRLPPGARRLLEPAREERTRAERGGARSQSQRSLGSSFAQVKFTSFHVRDDVSAESVTAGVQGCRRARPYRS